MSTDDKLEGQLDIFDIYYPEVKNPLVGVSKVFARAIKQMNVTEWKTFIFALTKIDFTKANDDTVTLDKEMLCGLLGIGKDVHDRAMIIKRALKDLPAHTNIFIDRADIDYWESGSFIRRCTCYKNIVKIVFDNYYFPLFTELSADKPYITMWASDLFKAKSERSILFYEDLRLHSDTRVTNERIYGIKDFKTLFGIPKDGKGSYMRKDGHFDRPAFEKQVINPLCEDLKNCEMIHLHINPDGKSWQKIHNKHNEVIGYKFVWDISSRPHIATAEEKANLVQQILEDNSDALAIAMNVTRAKKSGREKDKKNPFHDYEQRQDYDFDAIDRLISNHD